MNLKKMKGMSAPFGIGLMELGFMILLVVFALGVFIMYTQLPFT